MFALDDRELMQEPIFVAYKNGCGSGQLREPQVFGRNGSENFLGVGLAARDLEQGAAAHFEKAGLQGLIAELAGRRSAINGRRSRVIFSSSKTPARPEYPVCRQSRHPRAP